MSDTSPSAAPTEDAAATTGNSPVEQSTTTPVPSSTFGASRGSGLARGKPSRPVAPAQANANPAPASYSPTAVTVLIPEREYKNPFATATKAAPASNPTEVTTDEASSSPAATTTEPTPAPEQVAAERSAPNPELEVEKAPVPYKRDRNASIEILAPEPAKSVPRTTWENRSAPAPLNTDPNRFIPEKNIYRPENKKPLPPREARQPKNFDSSERHPARAESKPATPAKKGFFAWLKGLFSPAAKTSKVPSVGAEDRSHRPEGGQHNRHHRGGHARYNTPAGDRRPSGDGQKPYENRGGQQDGGGRRRRRGGRDRQGGGDFRPDHRSPNND